MITDIEPVKAQHPFWYPPEICAETGFARQWYGHPIFPTNALIPGQGIREFQCLGGDAKAAQVLALQVALLGALATRF